MPMHVYMYRIHVCVDGHIYLNMYIHLCTYMYLHTHRIQLYAYQYLAWACDTVTAPLSGSAHGLPCLKKR